MNSEEKHDNCIKNHTWWKILIKNSNFDFIYLALIDISGNIYVSVKIIMLKVYKRKSLLNWAHEKKKKIYKKNKKIKKIKTNKSYMEKKEVFVKVNEKRIKQYFFCKLSSKFYHTILLSYLHFLFLVTSKMLRHQSIFFFVSIYLFFSKSYTAFFWELCGFGVYLLIPVLIRNGVNSLSFGLKLLSSFSCKDYRHHSNWMDLSASYTFRNCYQQITEKHFSIKLK